MGARKGWLVTKGEGGALVELPDSPEAQGLVQIDVTHSSLNYKDALALAGRPGVIRTYPLVAGIDAEGTLASGERVVVTGAGLGEEFNGGLATRTWAPREALIPVPRGWEAGEAAAVGTAGFTAALCALSLSDGCPAPGSLPVAVTGASGGVGSIAIALLSSMGYEVHAFTGRVAERGDVLRGLGASEVRDRAELTETPKPLLREEFAGAVDAVGGTLLAGLLARTAHSGVVAACGLAASTTLPTTVLPFILRSVRLQGVDSVRVPRETRERAWQLLEEHLDRAALAEITRRIPLSAARAEASRFLDGHGTGRVVVEVAAG